PRIQVALSSDSSPCPIFPPGNHLWSFPLLNVPFSRDRAVDQKKRRKVPLKPTKDALSPGFKNISRRREEVFGFGQLLEAVSKVDPNIRIRYTSPHPKDFPVELLRVIRDNPNICRQIHFPAQSGSTSVLQAMRRGYSRE